MPSRISGRNREGDAGTAAALEDALTQIAEGEGQRVFDMIENAPPGPIETRWGLGFRDYDECMDYIRANGADAMTMASVPVWDCQLRLVCVHHEHREELGRLRLAGIGADAAAVADQSDELGSPHIGSA